MNKKTLAIVALLLILPVIPLILKSIQSNSTQASYFLNIADFNDDRVLVGVADNVFVAKIKAQLSNESLSGIPATQFSADIISNLKGELWGEVIVEQLPEEDVIIMESDNTYRHPALLQPGYTYIFATLHDPKKNRQTMLTHSNAHNLISKDSSLNLDELNEILRTNNRYMELTDAFKNQISLEEYWDMQDREEAKMLQENQK